MTCVDCDKEFNDFEEVIHISGCIYCIECADRKGDNEND